MHLLKKNDGSGSRYQLLLVLPLPPHSFPTTLLLIHLLSYSFFSVPNPEEESDEEKPSESVSRYPLLLDSLSYTTPSSAQRTQEGRGTRMSEYWMSP